MLRLLTLHYKYIFEIFTKTHADFVDSTGHDTLKSGDSPNILSVKRT